MWLSVKAQGFHRTVSYSRNSAGFHMTVMQLQEEQKEMFCFSFYGFCFCAFRADGHHFTWRYTWVT